MINSENDLDKNNLRMDGKLVKGIQELTALPCKEIELQNIKFGIHTKS